MQLQYLWHVVRLMTTVELKIPAIHFILLWPVLYSWGWSSAAACTWVRWCAEFWWTSCWRDSSSGLTPPSTIQYSSSQLVIFTKNLWLFSVMEKGRSSLKKELLRPNLFQAQFVIPSLVIRWKTDFLWQYTVLYIQISECEWIFSLSVSS